MLIHKNYFNKYNEHMKRERNAEGSAIKQNYQTLIKRKIQMSDIDIERLMKELKETKIVLIEKVEITQNENYDIFFFNKLQKDGNKNYLMIN